MVREAETHAEEDKKERARIDARNEADSLVYSTEKSLKEYGDKISAEDKAAIETSVADLKALLENQSASAEELKAKSEVLQQAAYKLAEEVYKSTSAQEGGESGGPEGQPTPDGDEHKKHSGNDNVEDADYEVVD